MANPSSLRFAAALTAATLVATVGPAASADLLTYQWDGTTAANSLVKNQTVQVVFTIDTDTALTSSYTYQAEGQPATSYIYEGAIVSGYYKVGDNLYPFVTEGQILVESNPGFGDIVVNARNTVTIVENSSSNGTRFNSFNISASTDFVERGGIDPSTILINIFDYDLPRDTVIGDSLDQPLDTLRLHSQGGVDRVAFGMGAYNGAISSTVTSGEGSISIVSPEPGSVALLGLGTLALVRRRR